MQWKKWLHVIELLWFNLGIAERRHAQIHKAGVQGRVTESASSAGGRLIRRSARGCGHAKSFLIDEQTKLLNCQPVTGQQM
jgi:hypothetical protein